MRSEAPASRPVTKPSVQEMIKFSAAIATYNRCDYVLSAIRSVMEQTYPAHEIIVVIDGSTDNTANVIREQFPNVILFEQPNLGPGVTHNTAIALATGDYVCFLDDDDFWHREKLQITVEYLVAHPDCLAVRNPVWLFAESDDGPTHMFGMPRDFVGATLEECHEKAKLADPERNPFEYLDIQGNSFDLMLERNRAVLSSTVVHRLTVIRAGGFCPMQTGADDWTMFVNVSRLAEWHTIWMKLGFTRFHSTQYSAARSQGLFNLVSKANAWHTGRPQISRMTWAQSVRKLQEYGAEYRGEVQLHLWYALRAGQFKLAFAILSAGCLILPRLWDLLYALIPPQITWRVERYILGMHKGNAKISNSLAKNHAASELDKVH